MLLLKPFPSFLLLVFMLGGWGWKIYLEILENVLGHGEKFIKQKMCEAVLNKTYLQRNIGLSPATASAPKEFRLTISSLYLMSGRTSHGPLIHPATNVSS